MSLIKVSESWLREEHSLSRAEVLAECGVAAGKAHSLLLTR